MIVSLYACLLIIPLVMAGRYRACLLVLAIMIVTTLQFTPRRTRKRYPGKTRVKELCKDRVFNEFFRDQTDDCAKVVKCDTSRTGLSTVTCSAPLVFDTDTQICNYQERVNNCDRVNKRPECSDEERDVTKCRSKVEEGLDIKEMIVISLNKALTEEDMKKDSYL